MKISAIDDNGKPVDWWFIYKLPHLTNAAKGKPGTAYGDCNGTEYLYCDANNPALPKGISKHPEILKSGALFDTVEQLRSNGADKNPNIGWFFYNDEHGKIVDPKTKKKVGILPDNGAFGHSKGVIAFDLETDSAFWILHSWPAFPCFLPASSNVLPPAPNFGQTFLCITLKDVKTLDMIANVFHNQSQPQIIEMSIPKLLDAAKYPNIVQLSKDAPDSKGKSKVPAGASEPINPAPTFTSMGGMKFTLFSKSKDWLIPAADTVAQPKDLYSDLIGPSLQVDLDVETWQDGEPDEDSDHKHTTEDIAFIDLNALGIKAGWHFTLHDHSKWAVSKDPDTADETDWVIIADINRIDSQYERGGCGIAFQNKALAQSLHSVIDMVPPAAFKEQVDASEKAAKNNETTRDAKRNTGIGKKPTAKKKAPAVKATASEKSAVKKKSTNKVAVKKTVVKKKATKKAAVKKTAVKKKATKKAAVKKTAVKKKTTKKAAVKKTAVKKKAVKKVPSKKVAVKKKPVKKSVVKKAALKKKVLKKVAPKKTIAKRSAAKKTAKTKKSK